MIQKIGLGIQQNNNQPNFKGGPLDLAIAGLQKCEQNPMTNVAVADLSTAIIPRTVLEAQTNLFAGLEAFRRESSGLIINCLIPGFIVAGIAKMIAKPIMGHDTKMAKCWANEDTINKVCNTWKDAKGADASEKVSNTFAHILNDITSVDGKKKVVFTDYAKDEKFTNSIKSLTDAVMKDDISEKDLKKVSDKAFSEIVSLTHASENIKFSKDAGFFSQGLGAVLESSPKILKELVAGNDPKEFAQKASKLVTRKSVLGMGVIIPLALAAQPINRWITEKTSGKKGAPIYKDFAQSKSKEQSAEEKAALTKQKIISISSMIGVAALSIMKKPSMAMLKSITQFKGIFPSMDQARIISTATFASRMASSEDKNDLREATSRDIATFSAFYFLGDYVAKGIASVIEKIHPDVKLINDLDTSEHKGVLNKIWHWTKNTSLKATDEIHIEKATAEATEKATKFAKNMRSVCQLGNLAFSLIALGLVIPKMYRKKTDEAREKELKEQGMNKSEIQKIYPTFTQKQQVVATENAAT